MQITLIPTRTVINSGILFPQLLCPVLYFCRFIWPSGKGKLICFLDSNNFDEKFRYFFLLSKKKGANSSVPWSDPLKIITVQRRKNGSGGSTLAHERRHQKSNRGVKRGPTKGIVWSIYQKIEKNKNKKNSSILSREGGSSIFSVYLKLFLC